MLGMATKTGQVSRREVGEFKVPLEKNRRQPRLRANHHLMEPEELTPDERWDRIVELMALMTMPEAPAVPDPGQ